MMPSAERVASESSLDRARFPELALGLPLEATVELQLELAAALSGKVCWPGFRGGVHERLE